MILESNMDKSRLLPNLIITLDNESNLAPVLESIQNNNLIINNLDYSDEANLVTANVTTYDFPVMRTGRNEFSPRSDDRESTH